MREADARVVELDDRLLARAVRAPPGPARARRRSPPPARPSVARERRRVAARRASRRGGARAGRRAARCRLSGTRSAWPGAGRVFVRTSSRPSSSAKNGLPAVASCTRASSGRVSSSPSRSSSRRCTAPRLSGPTVSRSSCSCGNERSSSTGLASSGPSLRRREQPERLVAKPPQSDLERAGRGRVEPLDVVERDEHRAALGQRAQHVQDGEPDRVRIGRRLARLREQQRDLERPPARRRERGPDVVEHVAEQLREPGEGE